MIGLLDLDLCNSTTSSIILPNVEIMKLATYYRAEENKFCRLLSLNEEDLSGYEKIYCFSESHEMPVVPESYLRAPQVEYGGTAFTKGKYIPFENSIIDYTLPKTFIYKDYLKQRYADGVKAKTISRTLDNTYYRCYANERLPIPPIQKNKQVFLYDRDFFFPNWREILTEISERGPSKIMCVHPIECHKLSEFFEIRNFPKFSRTNITILDLDLPLDEVYYMTNKYKSYLLADITPISTVYLKLGGSYDTNFQYFHDLIYKLNLLYCLWSVQIPIKLWYEPPYIGYKNPLSNISKRIATWTKFENKNNLNTTINQRITTKKVNMCMQERDLLLKFHPTARTLFNQSYNSIQKGGRWRP